MNRLLFLGAQSAQNIMFGLVLLYLSHLKSYLLVVEYTVFFLIYAFVQPFVGLRYEQAMYARGSSLINRCLTSTLSISLITLGLCIIAALVDSPGTLSGEDRLLSFLAAWMFGLSAILRQFMLNTEKNKNSSILTVLNSALLFIIWLMSEDKSLSYFLKVSLLFVLAFLIWQFMSLSQIYNIRPTFDTDYLRSEFGNACKLSASMILGLLSANLLIIIFQTMKDTVLAANLLLLTRLLMLPISVVGVAASQIISNHFKIGSCSLAQFRNLISILAVSNIAFFSIVFVLPEDWWDLAGMNKGILAPHALWIVLAVTFRSIGTPFTGLFNVFHLNSNFLWFQIAQVCMVGLLYGVSDDMPIKEFIFYYALLSGVFYSSLIARLYFKMSEEGL